MKIISTLLTTCAIFASVASSQALVVVLSDTEAVGSDVENYLNSNFLNIDEIRHGNFANFANAGTQDALNGTGAFAGAGAADIVIIGRTLTSAAYSGGAADGYNTLSIPIVALTTFVTRPTGNRLGWHAGTNSNDQSILGAETTITAAGATIFGSSGTVDWFDGNTGDDFNGLTPPGSFGGGTILSTIGGDIQSARWEAGDAPGDVTTAGVANFPGDRLLFNLDNDGGTIATLTPAGQAALIAALETVGLQAVPEPSSALLGLIGIAGLMVRRRR